jgi:hypothetical protein
MLLHDESRGRHKATVAAAVGVSRMTLIRLVRAMPEPTVSVSPRVLGVDEFALRKGAVTPRCWLTSRPGARPTSWTSARFRSPRGWLPGRELR